MVITLLLTVFLSLKQNEPYFEGYIDYKCSVEIIKPSDVAQKQYDYFIENGLDKNTRYYYKNEKHLYDDESGNKEFYEKNAKVVKIKLPKNSRWIEYDISKARDEIVYIKDMDEIDTIAGIPCKSFEIKTQSLGGRKSKLTRRFYYNSSVARVNPKYMKKYKKNEQNVIFSKMNAMYLGYDLTMNDVIMKYRATKIVEKSLDDSIFNHE